jgi:hypothetical protein
VSPGPPLPPEEVMQEPVEQSCGVIACAFHDPSGNRIRIGQELGS